ncbi:MAG: hypothetical protein GWN07_01875, partial [Actinobacteria bacterium]|nr:hypothetical protein [Actinomycetota bacterium]NIU64275.1 hypothetical protein [Actinomycetota bacterium]NIW26082.1 hypothetical protein [Actinomycetota bacterium]NIX18654.1 hypothetical protein [Actinomycetota bacterium]
AAFEIGARGGIIDVESTAYDVVLDFGDGERADLTIPAATAVEWSSLPIEHAWAEPGLHQVVLQLFDDVT